MKSNRVPEALSGDWLGRVLSRHWGVALALCAIIMVGMWQNFHYQHLLLNEARMEQSVEQERRRALVYTARREEASRPTNIKIRAEKLGLKMSENPPKKVMVNG